MLEGMARQKHTRRSGSRIAAGASLLCLLALGIGAGTSYAATDHITHRDHTGVSAPQASASAVLPSGWRRDMLSRVNAIRAGVGVAPLESCPSLRRAAQDYALLMSETGTFSHLGPDGSAPWDRVRAQGYVWQATAENIAVGHTSVDAVLRAWMASPDHAANMLDPRMREVGFGFAVGPAAGAPRYWVQSFGWGSGC